MFVYYNINPLGKTENDCVNRAIALATGCDYEFIYYLLYDNSIVGECDMLVKGCYRHILEEHFGLKPRKGRGHTVGEIAKKYPHNNVIMRVNGHVTCSITGNIYDIWDCSDEIVDEYWVVE